MDGKLRKSALLYALLAVVYLILRSFMYKSEVPYDFLSLLTLISAALLAIFILGEKKVSLFLTYPGYVLSFLGYLFFLHKGNAEYLCIGCAVVIMLLFILVGMAADRLKMFHVKHQR